MGEDKIINHLKKGDYRVFKYLYAHYFMIEKYIIQNNGNKADAKDLFQNSLIVLYENVQKDDFILNSKISTYLFSICKNNWLKKLTREKEISTNIFDSNKAPVLENEHPSEKLLNYLLDKLKKIGEPCKSLITLFHFDKLNWDQIASKMNYATPHVARNQKYKCFLKIRKLIPLEIKNELLNNGN